MKILVTGGGGFLGTTICKKLKEQEHEVVSFSRNHYIHLDDIEVETVKGDLRKSSDISEALIGVDAVIHTAALAGVWGRASDYYSINYEGTKNLVDACKIAGIKFFVYTSTPSVVFGKDDIINGDESIPYPTNYLTDYAYSKHLAEKYVLDEAKNSVGQFNAVAIRPHLIWGPGDPHIIPRIISKARSGKLKIVGNGENLVDIIYVDNAADAHVSALQVLLDKNEINGRAYFIGQDEPVKLWEFINKILLYAQVDPVIKKVSFKTAYRVGFIMEKLYRFLGINKPEPPMTRFVATQLAKSHYFNHTSAKTDLSFTPKVSIEEGLKRTFPKSN